MRKKWLFTLSRFFNSGFFRVMVIMGLMGAIFAVIGASLLYYFILKDMPSIDVLKDYRPSISTRIYGDSNELIDEFYTEDRKVIKIAEIPPVVIHAFIASEDSRFYYHKGFDFISMVRAFFKNLEAGKVIQGGSTITQQVAKALYLSPKGAISENYGKLSWLTRSIPIYLRMKSSTFT